MSFIFSLKGDSIGNYGHSIANEVEIESLPTEENSPLLSVGCCDVRGNVPSIANEVEIESFPIEESSFITSNGMFA